MAARCLGLVAAAAGALVLLDTATTAARPARLRGIRFTVDTLDTPPAWRGPLTPFVGTVEYAAGRGRVDVTALRGGPAVAVNGITMTPPLARPGDYYLFDSTGFVLVRPATRAFSRFVLTRAWSNRTDSSLPGEFHMRYTPLDVDTLAAGEAVRRRQHGPITIRMHLDRRNAAGSRTPLARAWLDVADAPAGEASVVRWFGAARILAAISGSVRLPPDSLQITAVVVLDPLGDGRARVNLFHEHALAGLAAVDIDPARLVLPAGFTEAPWPGVERAPRRSRSGHSGDRWRLVPAPSHE